MAIWRWAAGRQPKPTLRRQIAEARLIAEIADELAKEDAAAKSKKA